MTVILVICCRWGTEFAPDRRAIVTGAWRLCLECRDRSTNARGSMVYPQCRSVLTSGTHRGECLGRRQRMNPGGT